MIPLRIAAVLFLFTLTLLSCGRHEVSRDHWMGSTPEERELIVRSFLGGEQAADSKGGSGSRYSRTPGFYRTQIDRLYAAGDERPVSEIWEDLSDDALRADPQ